MNSLNLNHVSVIIPVYNDQIGIETCLAALAAQTYPRSRYKVIVVDNASNPPISVAHAFSSFTRLVVCQTPGSYAARNAGIAVAHGEILAFTDADCVPDRSWISKGVAHLTAEERHCIIGGDVKLFLSKKPTAVERYQHLVGFQQRENIESRGFTATANIFISKTQIDTTGVFNEKLLSGGDREWSWRAAQAGYEIRYSPETIVYTEPRTSLSLAIRQARRVAGGRFYLKRYQGKTEATLQGIKRHRSSWSSTKWLLTHPELVGMNRLKVFMVAFIIKLAHFAETIRVYLLGKPERR